MFLLSNVLVQTSVPTSTSDDIRTAPEARIPLTRPSVDDTMDVSELEDELQALLETASITLSTTSGDRFLLDSDVDDLVCTLCLKGKRRALLLNEMRLCSQYPPCLCLWLAPVVNVYFWDADL